MSGKPSLVRVVRTSSPSSPAGDGNERLGVDDLDDEVVFVDVEAVALAALARDAGGHDLGEAVGVDCDDVEALFYVGRGRSRPSARR